MKTSDPHSQEEINPLKLIHERHSGKIGEPNNLNNNYICIQFVPENGEKTVNGQERWKV